MLNTVDEREKPNLWTNVIKSEKSIDDFRESKTTNSKL